jgi:hypothetical protein
MREIARIRFLLPFTILGLLFWTLPRPAAGCEICKANLFLGFVPCRSVTEDEVGSTICQDQYDPIGGSTCEESGTFCSGITVGGGGGGAGGTGGAGGNPCQTSSFCPASCFSCGGGGGRRPAV